MQFSKYFQGEVGPSGLFKAFRPSGLVATDKEEQSLEEEEEEQTQISQQPAIRRQLDANWSIIIYYNYSDNTIVIL